MIESSGNRIEKGATLEKTEGETSRESRETWSEKSGSEIAEKAHFETKESALKEHGEIMSSSQRSMLESAKTGENLHVVESEDYVARFPDVPFDVVGHCDRNGDIYIKNISPEAVKHISTHETMHLCAYRNRIENSYDGSEISTSGLRDFKETRYGELTSVNTGINEGVTEMYTLKELENRGEIEAANVMHCYAEERMWAERLEEVVGKETVEKAYFGGDRSLLINEFTRLNNNDVNAWNSFSENVDILYKHGDRQEMEKASRKLTNQYFTMIKNKYN